MRHTNHQNEEIGQKVKIKKLDYPDKTFFTPQVALKASEPEHWASRDRLVRVLHISKLRFREE
jgi:hypothetical protein